MTRAACALIPLVTVLVAATPAVGRGDSAPTAGTRLAGLRTGPYFVGFDVRSGIDPTRRINGSDEGTALGLAIWYPARPGAAGRAMSALEYRLVDSRQPPGDIRRRVREGDEIDMLVSWRHVGIVAMTREQARASLATTGVAIRNAAPAAGRFPVVVIAGGPYYLSTTAEVLASHGLLVVAAFRFGDQSNEIGTLDFTWYVENSVRDAAWAIAEIARHPQADASQVALVGHGGGGMTAMLAAMRDRTVDALVNIDAGNFSNRSQPERLAFYSPRLLTIPYLYIATAETRKGQDRFDQFLGMRFSERTEVVLDTPDLRHHDLSDFGRAVTEPLGIRGDARAGVQQAFGDVQDMTVRFLVEHLTAGSAGAPSFRSWLEGQNGAGRLRATRHPGIVPAPTVVDVTRSLGPQTVPALRTAHQRDPEAPLFRPEDLGAIVEASLAHGEPSIAAGLSDFAAELHPGSARLLELGSQAHERRGGRPEALRLAKACAAVDPGNDWRAGGAVARCRAAVVRLETAR
jgi:hypothetical protein